MQVVYWESNITVVSLSNKSFGLLINNSYFIENSALNRGGALYLYNDYILIENCYFLRNKANQGGVIYFDQPFRFNITVLHIRSSKFDSNYASLEGGVIKITGMIVKSINSSYTNNSSPYGNNIAAYPIKIGLYNQSFQQNISEKPPFNYFIDNQVTGSPIKKLLIFKVLDLYNQKVSTLTNQIAQISIKEYGKTYTKVKEFAFVGKESVLIEDGNFSYDNATLYSNPPDSILSLTFTTSVIQKNYLVNKSLTLKMGLEEIQEELRPDLSLNVGDINISDTYYYLVDANLRKCEAGEIYNYISKSCSVCPYKTYSFNPNDSSCSDCPQNSVCLGGTNIMVNPGFWRSYNESISIHPCTPNSGSCLGGVDSVCALGYAGPLCQTCELTDDKKYLKTSDDLCIECEAPEKAIPEIVFKILGILIFYAVIIWSETK